MRSTIASTLRINLLSMHLSINNINKKTNDLLITKLYLACKIFVEINIKREIDTFKKKANREVVSTSFRENCADIMFDDPVNIFLT